MGLLDNYTGIGMSPRPQGEHQRVIANLIYGLMGDGYNCLPEFCVDDNDLNSPAPDVVIYENEGDRYPVVIIEVTTSKECKKIKEKVVQLMKDYDQVKEAFVYDYEKDEWFLFSDELDADDPSYSNLLEKDFSNYL